MDMAIELIGATEGGVVAASLGPPKTRKRNVMLLFSQRVVLALCNGACLFSSLEPLGAMSWLMPLPRI